MTAAVEWVASHDETLGRRCLEFARRHALPGLVVGVVVGDQVAWRRCYGVADVDTGRTPDERTLFQIASITKTFTATGIVQLRDRGLLELDAPAVEYLPELGRAGGLPYASRITVRQLLQHSSGLQGNPPPRDPRRAADLLQPEVVASLPDVRVLAPPGTEFRYSNLGYRLLAEIIHRLDGRPWPDYARAEILMPLGMSDSGAELPEHARAACARPHRPGVNRDRPVPVVPLDPALAVGDGDLWSSLSDLVLWVAEQLAPTAGRAARVLSAESLREMQAGTFVASPDRSEARGLGWNTVRRAAGVLVTHGGLLDGFNSHVCFSPVADVGVIALANGTARQSVGDLAWELADLLVEGRPVGDDGLRVPSPPPAAYEPVLGRFVDPSDGQDVRVEFRDGRLLAIEPVSGESEVLEPTDEPLLFLANGERWQFLRDASGTVDAVNARGYPLVREQA